MVYAWQCDSPWVNLGVVAAAWASPGCMLLLTAARVIVALGVEVSAGTPAAAAGGSGSLTVASPGAIAKFSLKVTAAPPVCPASHASMPRT
jgi:hypothetical protein